MLFASFVNGQFVLGSVKARPCLDQPDETIDGFPELAVTLDTIRDPVVKAKLRALARRIVASHSTPNRIIGFEIHGHADVDLRLPPGAERTQTELEVSVDRAEHARDFLLELIEKEGGKPIIAGIRANASALGVGSKCRKVINARTEAEMKKNRRVEIFLKEFRSRPVPPQPEPKPIPRPPEPGRNWKVQIKSGTITSGNSPVGDVLGFARISLNVVITDVDRKQQASFVATAEGVTVSGSSGVSPLPFGTTISRVGEGSPRSFTTHQSFGLQSFNGALFMGQNPSAGVSLLSAGGTFVMTFTALPSSTTPRIVEVPGGNDPFALPQVSLGIAPGDGRLTIQGSPGPVK